MHLRKHMQIKKHHQFGDTCAVFRKRAANTPNRNIFTKIQRKTKEVAGMTPPRRSFIYSIRSSLLTQNHLWFCDSIPVCFREESHRAWKALPAAVLISLCAAGVHIYRWCWFRRYPAVSHCARCDCFWHGISLQTWDHCPRRGDSPHRLPHQRLRGRNPQNQPKGWENMQLLLRHSVVFKHKKHKSTFLALAGKVHIFIIPINTISVSFVSLMSSRYKGINSSLSSVALSLHRSGHCPRPTQRLRHPKRF